MVIVFLWVNEKVLEIDSGEDCNIVDTQKKDPPLFFKKKEETRGGGWGWGGGRLILLSECGAIADQMPDYPYPWAPVPGIRAARMGHLWPHPGHSDWLYK